MISPENSNIYFPFRIVDYYQRYINHTNLLYPIVSYIYAEKQEGEIKYPLKRKKINYKQCSETSMKDLDKNIYITDFDLDKFYCIDMNNINLGGDFTSDFLYYLQFDIYLCKNGKIYNESDLECTSYEKIENITGINNSLIIQYLYPSFQIKPKNFENPVNIIYFTRDYQISKFTNKRERMYLKENIFSDKYGLFWTHNKNNSYWSLDSFTSDHYFSEKKKNDLIATNENSRIYSICIYFDKTFNLHERQFKNFYEILAQNLPFIIIIFDFFKIIIKIFKEASIYRKISEFLYVNQFDKKSPTKINPLFINRNNKDNKNNLNKIINFHDKIYDNNCNRPDETKSSKIFKKMNFINYKIAVKKYSGNVTLNNDNSEFKKILDTNINLAKKNIRPFITMDNISNNKLKKYENKSNISNKRQNSKSILNLKSIKKIESIKENEFNLIHVKSNENSVINKLNENNKENKLKEKVAKNRFPYKYHCLNIFLKNIDISQVHSLFPKNFVKTYETMGHILDINNYLSLYKQVYVLKEKILKEQQQELNMNINPFIERKSKAKVRPQRRSFVC